LRAREQRLDRLHLERSLPQLSQLPRGSRQHDREPVAGRHDEAGSGADEPDRDRILGSRRLLRHAGREVGVRTLEPFRDRARAILDLSLERGIDDEIEAGRGREQLDRPVVVRGPETSGDDAEIGPQPLGEGGCELARRVADDRDARRRETQGQQLSRQERPVQVGALAADELAAGDDDRDPGPASGGRVY